MIKEIMQLTNNRILLNNIKGKLLMYDDTTGMNIQRTMLSKEMLPKSYTLHYSIYTIFLKLPNFRNGE
jgi:hypothetical protein